MVESSIRTKKSIQRALHIQSGLSAGYWPLTSAAARFLMNRMPRASNEGMITPYEAYFGVQPDLSSIRAFGSTCYYWLTKEERRNLSQYNIPFLTFSTALRGTFVGYDEHRRAYRVLPDGRGQYVLARTVVFDERTVVRRMLGHCARGGAVVADPDRDDDALPLNICG